MSSLVHSPLLIALMAMALALPATANAQFFSITDGNLELRINETTGAIHDVLLDGGRYYFPGTPGSHFGFAQPTDFIGTFALNASDGGQQDVPVFVFNGGTYGQAMGSYDGFVFNRTYSLVPGQNTLQVATTILNTGADRDIVVFDTFDPDQGFDLGEGHTTSNDVQDGFGSSGATRVAVASSTSGRTVVMGSTDGGSVVASGSPFLISNGLDLENFLNAPHDGNGTFADQGSHIARQLSIASGHAANFVYFQTFGNTPTEAQDVFTQVTGISPTSMPPFTGDLFTEQHPVNSSIALDVYLGNPDAGGIFLATVGPTDLVGQTPASINLDVNGNGTVNAGVMDIDLTDFVQTLNLGALGTIDVSFAGVHFSISTGDLPVNNNGFTLDDAGGAFSLVVDAGIASLFNPTGLLATLLPTGATLDFNADPLFVGQFDVNGLGILGTTDKGPGLFSNGPEINLDLSGLDFLLFNFGGTGELWARSSGSVHVAVPEAGSMTLMLLAASVGLTCVARRRSRVRNG